MFIERTNRRLTFIRLSFANKTWNVVDNLVTLQQVKQKNKMADRNDCRFVGRIGERMKKGKTVNGEPYMYFDMNITSKYNANSTENNYEQNIPIMVFKPAVIKYLEKLKVHVGTPIVVFGFVSTYTDELKGITLKSNGINANEVYVIQTRPYND